MDTNPEYTDHSQNPPLRGQAFINALRDEHAKLKEERAKDNGMFTMLTANEWIRQASLRPVPKMLFSEYWHEGELCILFADTNTGKSILAVQIADAISRGVSIPGFHLAAEAQPVIYFDFELFDKQFEARYSVDYAQHYAFNNNLLRSEINPDNDTPDGYACVEDYLHDSIATCVMNSGARVLIIDNITYLREETERAKDALPLMKHLKALKQLYGLSILALAHTPKRDMSKPLTRNDLSGSKMLMNFCDSSFCIGESATDKSLRYLKQIKARSTEIKYDSNNVQLCRIEKPHNFLKFTHAGYGSEYQHLKDEEEHSREWLAEEIRRKAEECPECSYSEIAAELGTSKSTVGRVMKGER
jgi:RecA-family ATPase